MAGVWWQGVYWQLCGGAAWWQEQEAERSHLKHRHEAKPAPGSRMRL